MIHIKFCPLSRRFALATLVAMAMVSPGANAQTGPQKLPTTQLTAGMHLIRAEVADDDGERQIGLMHRPSMGASDGMVFVFEQPGVQCFWMRNTLIPLSAAFIDDSGTIVNIEDMKPQTHQIAPGAPPQAQQQAEMQAAPSFAKAAAATRSCTSRFLSPAHSPPTRRAALQTDATTPRLRPPAGCICG